MKLKFWEKSWFEILDEKKVILVGKICAKFRHSVEKRNPDLWIGYCLFGGFFFFFWFKLTKIYVLKRAIREQIKQSCVTCR